MTEALYIHIPFCLSKCPYCSFSSTSCHDEKVQDQYVDVILRQIKARLQRGGALQTVFLGGGTPTILSSANLEKLLTCCCEYGKTSTDTEISIEANPKTLSGEKLRRLKTFGVNRLSVGIQSFNEQELKWLGRPYSVKDVDEIVDSALSAGFFNISLDLMYGLPFQTEELWQKSLERALSYPVTHLSIYQLTVEAGTPYEKGVAGGKLILPAEDTIEELDSITKELTDGAGFERYEISNYARPGYSCSHNINYWRNNEYFGVGAGAVEYLNGERCWYAEDVKAYLQMSSSGDIEPTERELLDREASFRETVIMGLRMSRGVSLSRLRCRYKIEPEAYYGDTLKKLIGLGMLTIEEDHLRLTHEGMSLANTVMAELV